MTSNSMSRPEGAKGVEERRCIHGTNPPEACGLPGCMSVVITDLRAQLQTLRGEKQTLEDVLADERAELAHAVEVENALTQEKAALEATVEECRAVISEHIPILQKHVAALEARERALVEALRHRGRGSHEFSESCPGCLAADAALAPKRGAL